jgi:putative ABC transport system substrate-binding protein
MLVPSDPEPLWTEFRAALRERGYLEGQNIALKLRSADGHPDRLRALADDLVRSKVNIIVASLTPAVVAARQATTETPIVMFSVADPVGTGLISSLARPGGNITGLSATASELYVKLVELIRELLPRARRVALLADTTSDFSRLLIEQTEEAGRKLDVAVQAIRVRSADELDTAFAAMVSQRADAFMMMTTLPRKPALERSFKFRLPLVGVTRVQAEEGALASYSFNQHEMYRRAASYIDRILKGSKPADLPVEQPTLYELVVNLKTAKALDIVVPDTVLARADEVIE